MSATAESAQRHRRNARGQGTRLADDIVRGALALVERTGSDEAVTLRAVAREVGIAAPSIYAHFADRDAIIMAAVAQVFDELTAAVKQAQATVSADPVQRLLAGCQAYLDYGLGHPARYGILFTLRGLPPEEYCQPVSIDPDGNPLLAFGAEAFAQLVMGVQACVDAGVSVSTDVLGDATAVWVAMHGAVTLRTALPGFPWPELTAFNRQVVLPLARVTG
ncbi:MAG TPA: TetR/AcrR family transcriptional regulator [Streptosporangiaceae bacterium]|nr:TetR/AcrR family transcriptional regulator [Streptosporangiaceae bacterium]